MKLVALAGFFTAAVSAFAQLSWERTAVELHPPAGAASTVAEFPFTNRTAASIEVIELKSSCGCTVPALEKTVYAPGEGGVLKATFDIQSRQGLEEKTIFVQTDAGATELKLIVHVPVRVEIAPRMLVFTGAERDAKAVRFRFRADAPAQEIAVASATGPFDVQVVAVEPGHDYELRVTPHDDASANVSGAIVIRSKGASGAEHFDTVFLRRRP